MLNAYTIQQYALSSFNFVMSGTEKKYVLERVCQNKIAKI